jgi:hypothetical protein
MTCHSPAMMIDLTGSEKTLLTPLWSAPSLMTTRHRREFALNALVTELICRPPSQSRPYDRPRRKFKR